MIYARNEKLEELITFDFDTDDYRWKSIEFLREKISGPFVVEFEYNELANIDELVNFFSAQTQTIDYFIYEIVSHTGEMLDSSTWVAENFVHINKLKQTLDINVYSAERGVKNTNYCDAYLWWEFSNKEGSISTQSINKKFLLLNGKDKPSRKVITSYLAGTALDDSIISYRDEPSQKRTEYHKLYGDYPVTRLGLKYLREPINLVAPINLLMQNVFCRIVTETNFERPYQNFSEKTLDTIRQGKPFVLVAPYKTLSLMKELGFKTFNRWWDESYDIQINPEKRLRKIIKVIDKLSNTSYNELNEMYKEMIPVLEHNLLNMENCVDHFDSYYRKGKQ